MGFRRRDTPAVAYPPPLDLSNSRYPESARSHQPPSNPLQNPQATSEPTAAPSAPVALEDAVGSSSHPVHDIQIVRLQAGHQLRQQRGPAARGGGRVRVGQWWCGGAMSAALIAAQRPGSDAASASEAAASLPSHCCCCCCW